MTIQTRWIGAAAKGSDINTGDLFVATAHGRGMLAIRVELEGQAYALVLADLRPEAEPDQCPFLVGYNSLVGPRPVIKLEGAFTVEPPSADQRGILGGDAPSPTPNGVMGLFASDPVVRVVGREGSYNISLSTGLVAASVEGKSLWRGEWRLVWRDGDEEVELCRLGGQPPGYNLNHL